MEMNISITRFWPSLLLLAIIAAGCASNSVEDAALPSANGAAEGDDGGPSDLEVLIESMDQEARMADPEADSTVDIPEDLTAREIPGANEEALVTIANVETFWTAEAPQLSLDYTPLDSNRLFPRSVLGETLDCTFNGQLNQIESNLAAFNAFVANCDEGITVVWDDIGLQPRLDIRFPGAGFAHLIAHEWGHVIQNQLGPNNRSVLLGEQQADCYSGAYVAWAEDNGVEPFTTSRARDLAIVSTLETRDPVGSSPAAPNAHGNGFDRVRAAQEGYDNGVTFCSDFDNSPPPITQMPFTSQEQADTGGNRPLDEKLTTIQPPLAQYFQSLSTEPIDEFLIEPDPQVLSAINDQQGDGGVSTLLGLSYAAALQQAVGEETNGVEPALRRACLYGTFLGQTLSGNIISEVDGVSGPLTLSPGDLDESIKTLTNSPGVIANPGLVFEFVSAIRIGTVEGINGCRLRQ